MKKKSLWLIHSLCMLVVSFLLCVTSIYAWFTNVNNADIKGIGLSIKDESITSVDLKRYIAVEEDNSYSLGKEISRTNKPRPYDDLASYDKIIYEFILDYKGENDGFIQISMNLKSLNRSTEFVEKNGEYYNFLSNVAVFYILDGDNGTFTKSTKQYEFPFYDENDETIEVSFGDFNKKNKIYLLFDYNKDNVNALYSSNIGMDIEVLYFTEDIYFIFE